MHMSDALLSPAVGAAFWAGSLGAIGWSARKLREGLDERIIPLMGVLGAFIFASQMINFTIPGTGSSGHLGGGMVLAILLGPYAALIVMASVLTVQAFFFADGGLLALGSNIWNLGIYPCFIAYPLIYRPIAGSGISAKRIAVASVVSAVIGLQLGAFSVVLQTFLSGRSELPFFTFMAMMQPVHLAIGLAEGFVTAGVIRFLISARPEILESASSARPLSLDVSFRRVAAGFLLAAVFTGGVLSWVASSNPDGLEWSVQRVFGKPELPAQGDAAAAPVMKTLQEKTALLPDYSFKKSGNTETGKNEQAWPAPNTGRSASGVLGAAIVLSAVFLIGAIIRTMRRKSS
ncbi:MAG: energy-coupling factor ABC transporter permease [Nitrospirae bacterium]|nr:energy-coupling factor ABC transporter permease [Nitrospirota bacterium]